MLPAALIGTHRSAAPIADVQLVDALVVLAVCIGVIPQCLFPDLCDARRKRQFQQRTAVIETFLAQLCHAVRNVDVRQRHIGIETVVSQRLHRVGQGHLLQRRAVGEHRTVELRHAVRHGNVLQRRTVIEAVLPDCRHLIQVDLFQGGSADETPVPQRPARIRHRIAGNRELRFARAQQEGALYRRVRQITDQLVHCLGDLAAWADYPEDEIPAVTPEGLQQSLTAILQPLEQTLATYDYGRILRAGVSAVIVGKPNVGKSTLFNLLSGSQRSIVTEIAGTTRDVVEEQIRLGDVTLRLSDTAGLRETEDIIEQIGVRRAGERLRDADLILAVFDATRPLDDDDRRMLEQLPEKPVIAILNKSDQPALLEPAALQAQFSRVISMAAKDGNGLEELRQAVEELFYREQVTPEMGVVSNERQKQCLEHARAQILQAQEALEAGEMLDAVTVLLEEAADALLTLTGERVSEAVVNDVFARFCVGK